MATESQPKLLSYDDYAAVDLDRPAQVIDGVLVMTPAPTPDHQTILKRLFRALDNYAEAHGGLAFFAPLDIVLHAPRPAQVIQPDAMYFSRERIGRIGDKNVQGAPDVVIEVASPSNTKWELVRKHALYAEHGVREYWLVPAYADRLEVYRLGPDGRFGKPLVFLPGESLTSEALPGLALDVTRVFADLRPPAPEAPASPDT